MKRVLVHKAHKAHKLFSSRQAGSSKPRLSSRRLTTYCAFALTCLASLYGTHAYAQASPDAVPQTEQKDVQIHAQPIGQWTGVWTRPTLLGDIGGLRPWLKQYGISLGLSETSELLGNTRGGLGRGVAYDGLTTLSLGLDTQKAFGLAGGVFNLSALQIHGTNLSTRYLGTLNTASGIEAQGTTRLWEMWYQQTMLDNRVDIKVGQQSLDQEFIVSTYAGTFINTMFGWPGVPSLDLPNGGPAYPLAALGIRARAQITPALTALAGVFDGDPLGNDRDNLSGTNFNLHNGALYIGELQYTINQPTEGAMVTGSGTGLPGTYKIGLWYHNQPFGDPLQNGVMHRGNYSFYAVADQMVWRAEGARSIGVFARAMGAPGDRNLASVSVNAGVVMKAPFQGRDNDSVGLGLTYIKVGNHARAFDVNNDFAPRGSETALEATYQYQVTPWWLLQGDLQYTFNAGTGQNPNDPTQALRNTFVLGARTTIVF